MDLLFLVAQAALLILAGVMVLRVREELQLLVRQASASPHSERIERLQEELQQTLREVRATLNEGIAKLEERIARAEQVLHALEAHVPDAPPESSVEPDRDAPRVPVERILALADSGCDVKEIARLTGMAEGEVQLVLQIRAQRSESSSNSQSNERTDE